MVLPLPSSPACSHFLISILASLLSLPSPTRAVVMNITVDDTYGDPLTGGAISYAPSGAWNSGPVCTECTARPSAVDAYDGTWHDATYYPPGSPEVDGVDDVGQVSIATLSFNGSAVYVYCILTGSSTSPDGNTDMTFFIDGTQAGTFAQSPNGNSAYNYSQLVFAGVDLSADKEHTLVLQSGSKGQKALVLLDKIVYTIDDSSSTSPTFAAAAASAPTATPNTTTTASPSSSPSLSSSSSSRRLSAGAIAGLAVGSLSLVLAMLSGAWWALSRRERRRRAAERYAESAVQPFFPALVPGGDVPRLRVPVPPRRRGQGPTLRSATLSPAAALSTAVEVDDAEMEYVSASSEGLLAPLPLPPPMAHRSEKAGVQSMLPPYPYSSGDGPARSLYPRDVKRWPPE